MREAYYIRDLKSRRPLTEPRGYNITTGAQREDRRRRMNHRLRQGEGALRRDICLEGEGQTGKEKDRMEKSSSCLN